MHNPTTYFAWDKPVVGGDTGAWGTILNTLHDAVDADMRVHAGRLGEQLMIPAAYGGGATWVISGGYALHSELNVNTFHLPISERLRVGQRITAFSSYGWTSSVDKTATVALVYVSTAGVETVVSAGHSLPVGAIGETTTAGLTHDVAADRAYFIKVTPNSNAGIALLFGAKLTLSKSP